MSMEISSLQSQNLHKEIDEILDCDLVNRHSFFQLQYFVVAKEYTNQSRMWCCIRELQARKNAIDSLKMQIDELEDDKKLILIQIQKTQESVLEKESEISNLDKEEKEIHIRKLTRKANALDKSVIEHQKKLKDAEEEAAFLAMAYRQLEKKECLLPYDDIKSQTEYWNEKLTQEVNLRLLTRHPLDLELLKTILALKNETPIKQQTLQILKQLELQTIFENQEKQKIIEAAKKET
jgi:hypothetical protein